MRVGHFIPCYMDAFEPEVDDNVIVPGLQDAYGQGVRSLTVMVESQKEPKQ